MEFGNINTKNNSVASLVNALGKTRFAKTDYSDDTIWTLQKDGQGNGAARIRFIPSKDGELFVEVRNHGSNINGKWLIENCRKTMGWDEACAICQHSEALKKGRDWKEIPKNEQSRIRPFFAQTSYWANILVESDPANPENEGRVFKFRFGKKILEKIVGRAQDDPLDGTIGINVFDPIEGASFKLKSKKVDDYINYDSSEWTAPCPIAKGKGAEEKITEIQEMSHEIGWMRTEENFKSEVEVKKKLMNFLGINTTDNSAEDIDDSIPDEPKESYEDSTDDNASADDGDGDDDAFDYFKNLSEEDV